MNEAFINDINMHLSFFQSPPECPTSPWWKLGSIIFPQQLSSQNEIHFKHKFDKNRMKIISNTNITVKLMFSVSLSTN